MTQSVTLPRVILLKVMPPLFDLSQQKLQTELETRLQKEMPSLADDRVTRLQTKVPSIYFGY